MILCLFFNLFNQVGARNNAKETELVVSPLNTTETVKSEESPAPNVMNADDLLLYVDFEDDKHDLIDSDYFNADDYQSDSESEWLDALPDDDVFVSEKDFPTMYLSFNERMKVREQQMSAQASGTVTGSCLLNF